MKHHTLKMKLAALLLVGASAAGTVGCESHAGNGALIGGAVGATTGAIIGNNTGNGHTAGGALIGGAVGALAGGGIGGQMDKAENERARAADRDEYYDARADYRRRAARDRYEDDYGPADREYDDRPTAGEGDRYYDDR